MNRKERLLDYLKNKQAYGVGSKYPVRYLIRGITVKECEHVLGSTELRKTICDLQDSGYKVEKVWEYGLDRFGNETRYKRYFVTGKEAQWQTSQKNQRY